jgi:hypothetical protein
VGEPAGLDERATGDVLGRDEHGRPCAVLGVLHREAPDEPMTRGVDRTVTEQVRPDHAR